MIKFKQSVCNENLHKKIGVLEGLTSFGLLEPFRLTEHGHLYGILKNKDNWLTRNLGSSQPDYFIYLYDGIIVITQLTSDPANEYGFG